jgi:hypothetical protein
VGKVDTALHPLGRGLRVVERRIRSRHCGCNPKNGLPGCQKAKNLTGTRDFKTYHCSSTENVVDGRAANIYISLSKAAAEENHLDNTDFEV